MAKKFVRRYILVILLFACVMSAGLLLFRQQSHSIGSADDTPTRIIMAQATVIEQGVQVTWLESQPAKHQIAAYIVERSHDGHNFEQVAHIENIFLSYLDTEGRTNDLYRVSAEDNDGGRSPTGEHITAAPAKPGSVVATAPSARHVLGAATDLEQAESPAQKAVALQSLISQSFVGIDKAVQGNDYVTARNLLTVLQGYQRQALSLWPQLVTEQKIPLAQVCAEQADTFRTNQYAMPEEDQFDATLVQAGCDALQRGVI